MKTIKELEELMKKHGLVIRAIKPYHIDVFEVRHKDKYPDSEKYYDERLKRNMIRRKVEHGEIANKFVIQKEETTGSTVQFYKPVFFNSIEEAIDSLSIDKEEDIN